MAGCMSCPDVQSECFHVHKSLYLGKGSALCILGSGSGLWATKRLGD